MTLVMTRKHVLKFNIVLKTINKNVGITMRYFSENFML